MRRRITGLLAVTIAAAIPALRPASAQERGDIRELKLRDWQPRSMLVTKATEVPRPAFPVIDVHNHLGGGKAGAHARAWSSATSPRWTRPASAPSSTSTAAGATGSRRPSPPSTTPTPGRFLTYALIDFAGIDDPGWSDREAKRLERELRGRRQGAEVPQDARPGRPLQGRPAHARRRPEARPDLGGLRPVQAARRDPHRRPRRLLHAAGPVQRALARAERAPRLALLRRRTSPSAPTSTPSATG